MNLDLNPDRSSRPGTGQPSPVYSTTKWRAMIDTRFEEAVYVDVDVIVAPDVNNLFDSMNLIDTVPLAGQQLNSSSMLLHYPQALMDILDISKKTQPYVHAASFISTRECEKFYLDCLDAYNRCIDAGITWSWGDEPIMNGMLWKYGKTDSFLPNYTPIWKYLLGTGDPAAESVEWKYIFHGCKDPVEAREVFNILINKSKK